MREIYRGNPFWKNENVPLEQRHESPGLIRRKPKGRRGRRYGKRSYLKGNLPPRKRETDKQKWASIRIQVFNRDGWTCFYCKVRRDDALLQVDHVIPLCRGGSNKMRNLITACRSCNSKKSGKMLKKKRILEIDRIIMGRWHERKARIMASKADEAKRLAEYARAMERDE